MHAVTSEASLLYLEGHERSLLAYLMTEPGACEEFLHRVSPEFLFVPAHRKMLDAIHDVFDHREKVNHITVSDRLREKNELDSCGGVARVVEISDATTSAEIADYALRCMLDAYRQREAVQTCKLCAAGKFTAAEAAENLNKILSELPPRGTETNWLATLDSATVTSSELASLALNERRPLLSDWLCEGDYGIIFAPRGVGKTWLGLLIAEAVATSGHVGEWKAPASAKVLYIDGEMPPDLMRERDRGLGSGEVEFLNHAILFDRTEKVLNITEPPVQQAILQKCIRDHIRLVILDNLSTLASGVKENDSFEWERLHNWLLQFRRHKIAVILIHHAGRSGELRGTSKREDAAFWIIALDDAKKHADDKRGAHFISRFTKPSRNTQEEIPCLEWHVVTDQVTGEVSVGCKPAQTMDVFRRWIEDGVTECGQLAEEMQVSKGTISKWAKKAMNEGWLRKKGREYVFVEGNRETSFRVVNEGDEGNGGKPK
jgi:putative DNA primase/helicase